MQRDVEIEIETTDKSGGFIGALYLNKNENAAVTLVSEGLATVHSFSADSLSWSKQLYDAEVRCQTILFSSILPHVSRRRRQKKHGGMYAYDVSCACQILTRKVDLV
jgi:hypothetical protein